MPSPSGWPRETIIPALDVATAGKPASSNTRALATSHAFGRMRIFLPRWSRRNVSAFVAWSVSRPSPLRLPRPSSSDSFDNARNTRRRKCLTIGPPRRRNFIPSSDLVDDAQDELASVVASEALRKCFAGVGEGEHCCHDGTNRARVNGPADLDELLAVGLHEDRCGSNAVLRCDVLRGVARNGDEYSIGPQHFPRSVECLPAHRVEDCVHVLHRLLESDRRVIQDLVGA